MKPTHVRQNIGDFLCLDSAYSMSGVDYVVIVRVLFVSMLKWASAFGVLVVLIKTSWPCPLFIFTTLLLASD